MRPVVKDPCEALGAREGVSRDRMARCSERGSARRESWVARIDKRDRRGFASLPGPALGSGSVSCRRPEQLPLAANSLAGQSFHPVCSSPGLDWANVIVRVTPIARLCERDWQTETDKERSHAVFGGTEWI